jgi:hypothetical protein
LNELFVLFYLVLDCRSDANALIITSAANGSEEEDAEVWWGFNHYRRRNEAAMA